MALFFLYWGCHRAADAQSFPEQVSFYESDETQLKQLAEKEHM